MNGISHTQKNITLHGKKIVALLFYCNICCLFLFGCVLRWNPTGDWNYILPNNYGITRINQSTISLEYHFEIYSNGSQYSSTLIPSYISAFCYNNRFIAVRWSDPDDINFSDLSNYDFSNALYYIVDSTTDVIYGPYETEADYIQQCELLEIDNFSDWIDVLDVPEMLGDYYYY